MQNVKLNGHRSKRLSNNINFCIKFVEGESLLIMLDQKGICASSGSACTSGSLDPSHVLTAIGLTDEDAHTSVRLSISEDTTKEEIDIVVYRLRNSLQHPLQRSVRHYRIRCMYTVFLITTTIRILSAWEPTRLY